MSLGGSIIRGTPVDSSRLTHIKNNKMIYANYIIQRNNVQQGCQGVMQIENGGVAEGNIICKLLDGARETTTTERDAILASETCPVISSIPVVIPVVPDVVVPVTLGLIYHVDAGNVASYPGSGSTWTDLTGSGKDITLYGSPTYSSANGGYLSFAPASSQYGESASSFSSLTTFSVEVWHYFNGTNTGTSPCIVSEVWPGVTSSINYFLGAYPSTSPSLQIGYYLNSGAGWQTSSAYTMTSGNWYQIVGTYDGTNLKLYVNGSLIITTASSASPISSGGGFRIMRNWNTADYWGGRLAIYRLYNRSLSLADVDQNFTANRTRFAL